MKPLPLSIQAAMSDEDGYRRLTGILLGAGLGLIYTLAGGAVNWLTLPGISLYHPPFGFWGNLPLAALWGATVGLICVWPNNAIVGILLAALVSILPAMVRGLSGIPDDGVRLGLIALVLGVPAAIFMVPAIAVLRAAANHLASFRDTSVSWQERWRRPLLLGLAMVLIGLLSLPSAAARATIKHMDQTLQAGLAANAAAKLPQELRALHGGDFLANADADYTLEWTDIDLDHFIDLRPANNYNEHSAVVVRFDNGHTLVCLYPTPQSRPNCDFRH